MADVQCGKFELIRRDPQTGSLTFRARLTPAPIAEWLAIFHEYQGTERANANLAVARIRGDLIEFEAPELGSKAAAEVIRRCVEQTNPEAATRQATRQTQAETQQKQVDDEWKRMQDKFRDGL